VPPRVWCGMAYLLIRDAVGIVPCSIEWEIGVVTRLGSHSARGVVVISGPYTKGSVWNNKKEVSIVA
jgi:hypothetical protein